MTTEQLSASLTSRSSDPDRPFALHALWADDPAAELARTVEREVFFERFGNSPELLAQEYGPYEQASLFLCVIDQRVPAPAGMIRIITPSAAGTKTLADLATVWERPGVDALPDPDLATVGPTWDIATLAVAPAWRSRRSGSVVSAALYQAVTMFTSRQGVRWMIATLDLAVLELIQSQCGQPFTAFAGTEPRSYLDSPATLPVHCEIPAYQARLAADDPATHAFMFEGRGLESVVAAPSWTLTPSAAAGRPAEPAG